MFRSARLKLTLFYLAILLAFSLTVTWGLRVLAEQEYHNSNLAQRSELRRLLLKPVYEFGSKKTTPEAVFIDVQDVQADQAALVRHHLNQQFALINLIALIFGGLLSYWFAGRTLRPIEEAHEAQARFASDASHELRTPLTNMRLENEVFLRQKSFSEGEARTQIMSNLEEVQRLERLAANLLDLTRYGQDALELGPIAIADVVQQALRQTRKNAAAKKVTIRQQIKPAQVIGHKGSLAQLLEILLDNAIKYGPTGGVVTLGGKPQDDGYVLMVCDEGPGIDEADLPFIFDRLYRGDKARSSKVKGYGLGLSLAQEIAGANQVTLTARNSPKKGACFEVRLNKG